MVASEVSWKYLCKIKRVIWSQTQYERNVSWSQRRRYIGPKIIWVLTYWWEYCLCMNCFVTQHLKHITTNGAAARSSAQRGARHTALAYWRWSPHTTLNTAPSTQDTKLEACIIQAVHTLHSTSPSQLSLLLDSFSMQHKCTILSGNGFYTLVLCKTFLGCHNIWVKVDTI